MIIRRLKYKCRACSEFFTTRKATTETNAEYVDAVIQNTPVVKSKAAHYCNGQSTGPIGVGDFVGFTEEEAP